MDDQDRHRYIAYFQRQLLRDGAEEVWQEHKQWFDLNRAAIADRYRSISRTPGGVGQTLASAVLTHQDDSEYDDFFAKQIFAPLVKKALQICEEGGFAPNKPVRLVNSPGLEASPAALPSTDEHLLFAGRGTFTFCNYWSKIFSSAIAEVATLSEEERSSPEAISARLLQGTVLVDAARLAVWHAHFDSLLGFGRLEQPQELSGFRVLLVNAMEIFAIGHEIGHFLNHEAHPNTDGIPPGSNKKELELSCDVVGLAVSTAYGAREENTFAFSVSGALLLFYAFRICEQVKEIVFGARSAPSDSHPSHEERFGYALEFLSSVGAAETIKKNAGFALDVAMCVGSHVQLMAHAFKGDLEGASA